MPGVLKPAGCFGRVFAEGIALEAVGIFPGRVEAFASHSKCGRREVCVKNIFFLCDFFIRCRL